MELTERVEAVNSSYFATGGFLQCIYFVFLETSEVPIKVYSS